MTIQNQKQHENVCHTVATETWRDREQWEEQSSGSNIRWADKMYLEILRKNLLENKKESDASFRWTGIDGMFAAMFAGRRWSLTGGNESVNLLFEIREKK